MGNRCLSVLRLCIRTGERISDVLKMRRADLTEEGIRFVQMKTGAKRIVPWTPELRTAVDRAKRLHGNVKALTLLHNRRGKAPDYSTVKIQWDKARKAAGVPDATIHDMRALAATWAKKQGKDATALLLVLALPSRAGVIRASPKARRNPYDCIPWMGQIASGFRRLNRQVAESL